jgi:NHLM bacteriocin system ABC transporter peptidase/ATP-binding protein
MEAIECGAASLCMISAHYGRWVTLEEMRVECGVSRDGSKAVNMLKAARRLGFVASGHRPEINELKKLTFPLIAFWNFNHFLVVEGYGSKKWYLNDPAEGPREVGFEEFDEGYSRVAMTFEPGPDFRKGGHRPSTVKALVRRARGLKRELLFAIIAGAALAILGLAIPAFSKIFVDEFLLGGMPYYVRPLLIAMGVAVFIQATLTWLQQVILLRLETKLALVNSSEFYLHLLRLPVTFFFHRHAGEVGSRIALNDRVASLLSGQLATSALSCFTAVFFFLAMLHYDLLLSLLGAAFAAVNLVVLNYVAKKRKDLVKRNLQKIGKSYGISMSGMMSIETIKASAGESDFFALWAGHQALRVNALQEAGGFTQVFQMIPSILTSLGSTVILGLGGIRIIDGFMSIGGLVAFQMLMTSFSSPFSTVLALGTQVQELEGSVQRLDDVLNQKIDIPLDKSENLPLDMNTAPKLSGAVTISGLTFGYSKLEKPLIQDFNLTLTPGRRVAIVGGSGSGKSTVAKMVAGIFEPWSGQILFDGKRREEIPRKVMTNSLAMVDQDIMLFEGSVRENIALWGRTLSDETVIRAARDACIHDDVSALKGGYDHQLEEGGRNLSGGQRQRLEIARSLAIEPSILIFDEATSALDPLTEKMVDENVRHRGCACLIVAHRLSTIRDCDEIIVLEGGSVVQRGTHEDMAPVEGPYAQLIRE